MELASVNCSNNSSVPQRNCSRNCSEQQCCQLPGEQHNKQQLFILAFQAQRFVFFLVFLSSVPKDCCSQAKLFPKGEAGSFISMRHMSHEAELQKPQGGKQGASTGSASRELT